MPTTSRSSTTGQTFEPNASTVLPCRASGRTSAPGASVVVVIASSASAESSSDAGSSSAISSSAGVDELAVADAGALALPDEVALADALADAEVESDASSVSSPPPHAAARSASVAMSRARRPRGSRRRRVATAAGPLRPESVQAPRRCRSPGPALRRTGADGRQEYRTLLRLRSSTPRRRGTVARAHPRGRAGRAA